MRGRLRILILLGQCAGAAVFADVPTLEDYGVPEQAKKNRFSARALFLESVAGAGIEYERAIASMDYTKAAIATSVNTTYQARGDGLKAVNTAEYSSFVDVALRLTLMPVRYVQFFAGGGATLYSTTVKLSDRAGATRLAEGSASFGGVALLGELGARLTFGQFSVGLSLSAARFAGQDVNFTYQSAGLLYRDAVYYRPLANERVNIFAGYLF